MSILKTIRTRLSRETSTGLFIPEIDGLRFAAILSVFVFHVNAYLGSHHVNAYAADWFSPIVDQVVSEGRFGVQLFFVISGLILSFPFATHYRQNTPSPSLRAYFVRRITRIEPPYIINILLAFLLLVLINKNSARELFPHLLANLGYFHNIAFGHAGSLNMVAWSLEIEVQFYLLAPLLALVFALPGKRARRLVILLAGVIAVVLQSLYPPKIPSLLSVIQYFLVGFLITDIYVTDWKGCPKTAWWWDVISALAWLSMLWLRCYGAAWNWLLPLFVLIAYLGAFRGRQFNRLFRNSWLTTVGGMCYTIYLYHPFIISFLGRLLLRFQITTTYWIHLVFILAIIGPVTLVACSVFFAFFEKPFMRRNWPELCWLALKGAFRQRKAAADLTRLTLSAETNPALNRENAEFEPTGQIAKV